MKKCESYIPKHEGDVAGLSRLTLGDEIKGRRWNEKIIYKKGNKMATISKTTVRGTDNNAQCFLDMYEIFERETMVNLGTQLLSFVEYDTYLQGRKLNWDLLKQND